jgi:hypothetical protein
MNEIHKLNLFKYCSQAFTVDFLTEPLKYEDLCMMFLFKLTLKAQ